MKKRGPKEVKYDKWPKMQTFSKSVKLPSVVFPIGKVTSMKDRKGISH